MQKGTALFLFITAIDNLNWYRKKVYRKLELDVNYATFKKSWKESTYEEKSEFLETHLEFDYDSDLINFIILFQTQNETRDKKKTLEMFKEYQLNK